MLSLVSFVWKDFKSSMEEQNFDVWKYLKVFRKSIPLIFRVTKEIRQNISKLRESVVLNS